MLRPLGSLREKVVDVLGDSAVTKVIQHFSQELSRQVRMNRFL